MVSVGSNSLLWTWEVDIIKLLDRHTLGRLVSTINRAACRSIPGSASIVLIRIF